MTAVCPICEEELYEKNPGVDGWIDEEYIVREMICNNEDCPLNGERQDWFFDFTRIDVDGDEIEIDELKKKFAKGKKQNE